MVIWTSASKAEANNYTKIYFPNKSRSVFDFRLFSKKRTMQSNITYQHQIEKWILIYYQCFKILPMHIKLLMNQILARVQLIIK